MQFWINFGCLDLNQPFNTNFVLIIIFGKNPAFRLMKHRRQFFQFLVFSNFWKRFELKTRIQSVFENEYIFGKIVTAEFWHNQWKKKVVNNYKFKPSQTVFRDFQLETNFSCSKFVNLCLNWQSKPRIYRYVFKFICPMSGGSKLNDAF